MQIDVALAARDGGGRWIGRRLGHDVGVVARVPSRGLRQGAQLPFGERVNGLTGERIDGHATTVARRSACLGSYNLTVAEADTNERE